MFSGTWSFTLVYTGSDKKQHVQICGSNVDNSGIKHPIEAAPIGAIPPAVSHIQIVKNTTDQRQVNFLVSWSGIGDNPGNVDYRIEIFDMNDICVEYVDRMTWRGSSCPPAQECTGTYDSGLNRVSFIVDGLYVGRLIQTQ